MMKQSRWILVSFISVFFISGCTSLQFTRHEGRWARSTLRHLTLRQKIAQMMVYHMNMRFINSESTQWRNLEELVSGDGVGGIHIWYGEAGTALTSLNKLQRMSNLPIIVDADIEKGLGQRYPGGTDLPPLMAIAATGDPANAYEVGRIAAREGRAVGIHINFSPIVDVNNNPVNPIINVRSFGEDPDQVSVYGNAFIDGLHAGGMAATAKHFPGHGDTQTDSHSDLATIPSDSTRLWNVELPPFAAVIDHGVDAVMVAHVRSPDYQPHGDEPATLSEFWINDVLKQRLGFRGVVITDAMAMGAITENYTDAYALIKTIQAGADIILQNHNLTQSISTVEQAVLSGELTEQRIDESVYKILLLKEQLGLHRQRYIDYDMTHKELGAAESVVTSRRIASEAVTLVKNENSIVPLRYTSEKDSIWVIDLYDYEFRHRQSAATHSLINSGLPVKAYALDASDPPLLYSTVLDSIPDSARVVINAFAGVSTRKDRISLLDKQSDFVKNIGDKTAALVVNSFGNPYLLQSFPEVPAYMVGYNSSRLMQQATITALVGNAAIGGKLPVTIPGLTVGGSGIELPVDSLLIPDAGQKYAQRLRRALAREVGANISHVIELLDQAVADSAWPGGVLVAAKEGQMFIHKAFGHHTYARQQPTTRGDIFDLASITKVAATTLAVMRLYEEGKLDLDDPITKFLPRLRPVHPDQQRWLNNITIRHLLTHTAGLPPFKRYYQMDLSMDGRWDQVYAVELDTIPGVEYVYSDIGMILLGKVVAQVSGSDLASFADSVVYSRLNLKDIGFLPPTERIKRIVPTEFSATEGAYVRGHVHDENSHSLGGITGHAGLFSTARDLAVIGQMLLNGGTYGDSTIFDSATVALFTTRTNLIAGSSRALGWDTPDGEASSGIYASSTSFGHTGFTGTSFWIDPDSGLVVVLLTNAVHPDRARKTPKYYDWRQRIHSAVYESFPNPVRNESLKLKERWEND